MLKPDIIGNRNILTMAVVMRLIGQIHLIIGIRRTGHLESASRSSSGSYVAAECPTTQGKGKKAVWDHHEVRW